MKIKPGIRLNISDGNKVCVDENHGGAKKACFGGVTCGWSEHKPYEAMLHGGQVITAERWWCGKAQADTVGLDECPLKLWRTMVVPVGFQNRNKL